MAAVRASREVATRTNDIIVSGPDGNARSWTFRRLLEDKRWDAEAVMRVRGSPSGTEFELEITIITELVDKPHSCRSARAGARQQVHDEIE